jgi:hypothetical protein
MSISRSTFFEFVPSFNPYKEVSPFVFPCLCAEWVKLIRFSEPFTSAILIRQRNMGAGYLHAINNFTKLGIRLVDYPKANPSAPRENIFIEFHQQHISSHFASFSNAAGVHV